MKPYSFFQIQLMEIFQEDKCAGTFEAFDLPNAIAISNYRSCFDVMGEDVIEPQTQRFSDLPLTIRQKLSH